MTRRSTLASLCIASFACSPAELDDTLDGVFPCETVDDCPPESSCLSGFCFRESPPSLEIVSPEEELAMGQPAGVSTMSVPVSLRGEGLELTPPGSSGEAAFGRGYVEISVDDVPVATVDSGELSSTVVVTVEIDAEPGGHMLVAEARYPDGARYDNPGSVARRFFWIDDGRPHVAMKAPLSQTPFGTGSQEVTVELATLNFSIAPPEPTTTEPGLGHVHFYYDVDLPACAFDPACDSGFVGVAAPADGAVRSLSTIVPLPPASAGGGRLTAVLRRLDHTLYVDENGYPIWTDVAIRRVDEDD